MSAVAVRRLVVAVCVAGIAGMIVSSIAGSNGAAMTFGLVTTTAVLCTIVATAVANGTSPRRADPDAAGEELEAAIHRVVERGADEDAVRGLVRDAIRYGRATR